MQYFTPSQIKLVPYKDTSEVAHVIQRTAGLDRDAVFPTADYAMSTANFNGIIYTKSVHSLYQLKSSKRAVSV